MPRSSSLFAVSGVLVAIVAACSSSSSSSSSSGGAEGPPVDFTVPAGGGSTDVTTPSGTKLTFDFPASAAGKTIVLTATTAASIGWTADDLHDVVKMEPDGTQFADPVMVRPSSGGVMLATFPTSATQTAPEWLALSADGRGAELHHFSTLGVVHSGCAATTEASSAACGGTGTKLDIACDLPRLCSHVAVSCCVDPTSGANDCGFGNASLQFTPSALDTGVPSYCSSVVIPDAAPSDSGADTGVNAGPIDAGGTGDAGVNGNCSNPTFVPGDGGTGTCSATRVDGTNKVVMMCTPSSCQCYFTDVRSPFGTTFSSGTSICGAPQLVTQQMIVNCGCPM